MTKQSAEFRRAVDELVATLPLEFNGRIVINVAANGGVKAELSEFVKIGNRGDREKGEAA